MKSIFSFLVYIFVLNNYLYGQNDSISDQLKNTQIEWEQVSVDENEYVIDYLFQDTSTIIILSKIKKDYFIKVNNSSTNKSETFPIDMTAKSLFKGTLGKIYVLTKNNAYQIEFLSGAVRIIDKYSIKEFQNTIANIVAQTLTYTIQSKINDANDTYNLTYLPENEKPYTYELYGISDEKVINILTYCDLSPAEKYRYNLPNTPQTNQRKAEREYYWSQPYSLDKIPKMKIITIVKDSLMYIFDLWNIELITYSLNTFSGSKIKLNLPENHMCELKYDEFTNRYYLLDKKSLHFYSINLDNGVLIKLFQNQITKVGGSVKISNGFIYSIKLTESGFHKLYRTKI